MWSILIRGHTSEKHVHEGRSTGWKSMAYNVKEGVLHHCHPFSMRSEMARWQYQGDTLRSTLAFVWCQECACDECWCVVALLTNMFNEGGSTGWKHGMWCEGVLHVMKDSSVTPSIFDEAWNGSLTIPRGHPEKHIGIRLVSGMRMWWMLMRCCTFEQHVHEGRRIGCKYGMWCEGALHVMKDSSVTPSIFDEVWNGSLTIPRGTPWEAHWHSFGVRNAHVMNVDALLHFWTACSWGSSYQDALLHFWTACSWGSSYRVQVWYVMWRCASCDEGLKCHAIHFRWGLKWLVDNTKGTPWEAHWHSFGVRNAHVMNVDALLHFWTACSWGSSYRVQAWYVMWRCASCDEGLKCHAIHFRWGLKWLVDNTKGTPWEAHWHSFGVRNAHVMNVDALLHSWKACSWGSSYRLQVWYVMWSCASCDEGLKCHAIHFRWGLKWLVDNTKGTPWEAHWHSFGVRNAHVMNVDALLHFWKAGGSIGWKRGMWCEGVLHVMKDSSVTPSIFDEVWNGSMTIPRAHPEKHIGIRLVSGMMNVDALLHFLNSMFMRVVVSGASMVCDVKVRFMWWRT